MTDLPAQQSGSIDVAVSSTTLPAVASDGTPLAVGDIDSAPVSSGKVNVSVAGDQTGRTKRLTDAAKDKIGTGVEKLGSGIGTIGEGVSKLGEKSRKVPLVGSSVTKLGEGISQMGESLHSLPAAARTRRGRLLLRSLVVGFLLVGTWITVIVAIQLRSNSTPDYRPIAEAILLGLSRGPTGIEEVYDKASPRFHEMVRKERFIDDMNDLAATVGKFREITAVNDTLVSRGPTGQVGRVSLTVAYEKATCRASVSLHEDKGEWKLLGVGVELPTELTITQAQREERVQACKSPMSKSCDLFVASNEILEQLRDGKPEAVWDAATQVFQKQEEKSRWAQIQAEHALILGSYIRILTVTEAKMIGGTLATFDVITEYARSSGVRVTFGFYRRSKTMPWKLRSFKTVLPMPRADEQPVTPLPGVEVPHIPPGPVPRAGSGSAAGSGSSRR
ncbi:MAG: hypothetical protein H0T42_21430 [Deltaproteobacteria bacterium]|nr:hypothetical protein [Deltaproteobacteria bacterium]